MIDYQITLGILAPSSKYFSGCFRKLTNSIISTFASSHPATSLKVCKKNFNKVETIFTGDWLSNGG